MKQVTLLNGAFIYFLFCSSILLGQIQTENRTIIPSERVEEKAEAKALENSTSRQSTRSSTIMLREALKRAQSRRHKTRNRKTDASATRTVKLSQQTAKPNQRVAETVDLVAIHSDKAHLAAHANSVKAKEKPNTTTTVGGSQLQ